MRDLCRQFRVSWLSDMFGLFKHNPIERVEHPEYVRLRSAIYIYALLGNRGNGL
jgi:hypothetical protein